VLLRSFHVPRSLSVLAVLFPLLGIACSDSGVDDHASVGASGDTGGSGSGASGNGGTGADGGNGGGTAGGGAAPGVPVPLGEAGAYVILAKAGISSVPASAVTGNVGISPAAGTFITGFALTADPSNVFSTSAQVTGNVYSATDAEPTPVNLTAAVADMLLASSAAARRAPDVTELGAGDIGGMTLPPAVYRWGTGLLVPTDLTLTGSATDVWVFQIAQDLNVANGVQVILAGGARPENVFWQVTGKVELGTTSHFQGIVLTDKSVALATGASLDGRLLAQSAVTLDQATVVQPSP
jgi:hypothetical protein